MAELDYMKLQEHYGGRSVALRGGEVVASAETYEELAEQLDRAGMDWTQLEIAWIDPPDVVCVY